VSLAGVKVGDEVVVTDVNWRQPQRTPVAKVGRVYVSTDRGSFHIENGYWQSKNYRSHRRAYTLAEWARHEAETALRMMVRKVADARSFGALSDDDLREATAILEQVAKKIGGAS
jgi:hypothetical protein